MAVASLAHARKKVQENESIIENQKKEIERYKKLAEMEHRNARNTFNSQASLIASNKNLRIVLGSAVAVASANFDGCAILGNAMQVASAANPNIVVPLLPRGVMRYPLIRHYLEGTGPLNNQMCFVCLLDFNPGDMVTYRNGD